ncbi:MAG: O-antigen ligase family protein [candidate division KSB1 bacterium]
MTPQRTSYYRYALLSAAVACALALVVVKVSAGLALGLLLGAVITVVGLARFEVLLHALIILLPLQSWIPYSLQQLGTLNPFNLLSLVIFVIWIVNAILQRERIVSFSWMNFVILFFVLVCVEALLRSMSFAGSEHLAEQLNPLKRWLSPILLFFPIANTRFSRPAIKRLVRTVLLMVGFVAVLTIKDLNDIGWHNISLRTRFGGAFGFGGENDLAAFFVFYPVIVLAVALFERKFFSRMVLLGIFALAMLPLILSLSRGAYLGMIAALGAIGLLRHRWLLAVLVLGVAFYEVWTPGIVQQRFARTVVAANERVGGRVPAPNEEERNLETSSAQRVRIWRGAMRIIGDYPVAGVGYNVFQQAIPSYANMEWGMDAHNMYLRIGAEMGLLGLAAFLALLVFPGCTMWRVYRTTGDRFMRGWMLGGMASICGILIVNVFGSRFTREELVGLYWVLVGLTYAYVFLRRDKLEARKRILTERGEQSFQLDFKPKAAHLLR